VKHSNKAFFKTRRQWFSLEYPYLNIYNKAPGAKGGPPDGNVSLRGPCMVDASLIGLEKHEPHVATRFRVKSTKMELILQAADPDEKKRWVAALQSNIWYANPAKKTGGVTYDVMVFPFFSCSLFLPFSFLKFAFPFLA